MTVGRHIPLRVSGSIAAHKAVYLARLLAEDGLEVSPLVTRSAARFVDPLSFSLVADRGAISDLWSAAEAGEVSHVELAHRIELVLIAPCTADVIARLAAGRAGDPLTVVALATRAPAWIAPAQMVTIDSTIGIDYLAAGAGLS